jgi:hypothetical protein
MRVADQAQRAVKVGKIRAFSIVAAGKTGAEKRQTVQNERYVHGRGFQVLAVPDSAA